MAKKSRGDTTIKTLIYILVFLIIILLLLIGLIIPNIKSYKLNKSDLKIFTEKNNNLSRKQVELQKNIADFKKVNSAVISKLNNKFDKDDFISFASKYLKDIKIKKITKSKEPSFEVYEFSAKTSSKSPVEFFKFVENLKNYKSIIKINFPISLVAKSNKIEVKFKIASYKKE